MTNSSTRSVKFNEDGSGTIIEGNGWRHTWTRKRCELIKNDNANGVKLFESKVGTVGHVIIYSNSYSKQKSWHIVIGEDGKAVPSMFLDQTTFETFVKVL